MNLSRKIGVGSGKLLKLYSTVVDGFSSVELPCSILVPFLKIYSFIYGVDLDDLPKPINEYRSFREFFTRAMKEGRRQVDSRENFIVSPVDGTIIESGRLNVPAARMLKVKDRFYTIDELIGRMTFFDEDDFNGEGCFVLFYLKPGGYHRVHCPVEGKIEEYEYISGMSFPVNGFGRRLVPDFPIKNARVVLKITSEKKPVKIYLIMIGALAVGNILLTYNGSKSFSPADGNMYEKLPSPYQINRGEEIGVFDLGSSVLMICGVESGHLIKPIKSGGIIKYGEAIAEVFP